ncbi:MAG: prolipoprotein diacylglyceryl transferase [Desulfobaccales bacterium]
MYPILYKLGPITLYTYGFMLAVAFLSAILVGGWEAERLGLPKGRFFDLCFYIILAALFGSRLLYVIINLGFFIQNPLKIVAMWEGGLVFHGGLIAAVLTAIFYLRRHQLPSLRTFDALALGMPLGQFFGRIGCFMAGCCFGRPTDVPWAVTFTHPDTLCPLRVPIHPAQLYESFLDFGVFLVLLGLRKRKRFDGQVLFTYFFLAGLVRFLVEFFRAPTAIDPRGPEILFHMPATQVTALGIALLSGAILLWRWRRSGTTSA